MFVIILYFLYIISDAVSLNARNDNVDTKLLYDYGV